MVKYEIIHIFMDIIDLLLFESFYIMLFRMRLICFTLDVSSFEELEFKSGIFQKKVFVGFVVYNMVQISKIVLTSISYWKNANYDTSAEILIAVVILSVFCSGFDLFMLCYFVSITARFNKIIFIDPNISKTKKFLVKVYLSLMVIIIFFAVSRKVISHSYVLF